ncbi:hypothetical protein ABIB75_007687 [Bradyrhizobium sp. GM2.2]
MNKMSIISELHKITDQCLLGAGSWPAEENVARILENAQRLRIV